MSLWELADAVGKIGNKEEAIRIIEKRCMDSNDLNETIDLYFGITLLHIAAKYGRVEICEMLLDRGANVNVVDNRFFSTPLHMAALVGHKEVCTLLLSRGADAAFKNEYGAMPYHLAKNDELCDLLLIDILLPLFCCLFILEEER